MGWNQGARDEGGGEEWGEVERERGGGRKRGKGKVGGGGGSEGGILAIPLSVDIRLISYLIFFPMFRSETLTTITVHST